MPADGQEKKIMTGPRPEDWRYLAERASHENDPKKLVHLVQLLCDELDRERSARNKHIDPHES